MHIGKARKPLSKRSVSASAGKPKRPRSRTASPTDRQTATGPGLLSLITERHRGPAQELTFLASGLGQVVAQVVRHVGISRLRATFADALQLVRTHPLQAVLAGVGLGYLLSRTKVRL